MIWINLILLIVNLSLLIYLLKLFKTIKLQLPEQIALRISHAFSKTLHDITLKSQE
jgi:hypothetical protein